MKRRSLATSLAVLVMTIFFVSPGLFPAVEPLIQFERMIEVDPEAGFQKSPRDFCITGDAIFIFPDYMDGRVKLLYNEGRYLKFLKTIGKKYGKEGFDRPMYCLYNDVESILVIIDYGARSVFLFERVKGKAEFELMKIVKCPALGYDMGIAGDGERLIVAGYTANKIGTPYDLYTLPIRGQQVDYLLPSHQKYYLENHAVYQQEYYDEQMLPGIGIQAFCDIQGDNVFYAWEGALRFNKVNLVTNEVISYGDKPLRDNDAEKKLGASYKEGKFDETLKLRKLRPYVKDIFATTQYVFLIYQPANELPLRIKIFTPEGQTVNDVEIPRADGNPGTPMYLDKSSKADELFLYALSKEETDNGKFVILKYKINVGDK